MINTDAAFDSNVLLYLISSEDNKAAAAENLLRQGGIVSTQVLNEITSVTRRKFRMEWPEIEALLLTIKEFCTITGVSVPGQEKGMQIAMRFGYTIHDSVILATALEAGCHTLYSEDMQHGQIIDGMRIQNPFGAV